MKIWRFENFIELVKSGSISAAAEHLHISPQALHQQMDTLENEVGCKLLVRSRKGVSLTAAGTVFYSHIGTLVKDYQNLIQKTLSVDFKEQNTIRATKGFLFTDHIYINALLELKKHHPEIMPQNANTEQIASNTCDTLSNDLLYSSDVYGNYASVISNCFIHVHQSHHLANKKQVRLEDLSGEVLMVNTPSLLDQLSLPFWQKIKEHASQFSIEALPFQDTLTPQATVLSTNHVYLCWGVQPSLLPELRQIPIVDSEFEYIMLYHKERYKESLGLRTYLEFMAQYYKTHWKAESDKILGR